jgi:transposase
MTLGMSEMRRKYDEEFRKNAVKLSYASPKTIGEVAKSLGVTDSMLYRWRKRYTADGDKTRFATLEEENRALRLEIAELKIEQDMLNKSDGQLCQTPAVKYRFISERKDYPTAKWAKHLKVSRSGYYSWLKQRKTR